MLPVDPLHELCVKKAHTSRRFNSYFSRSRPESTCPMAARSVGLPTCVFLQTTILWPVSRRTSIGTSMSLQEHIDLTIYLTATPPFATLGACRRRRCDFFQMLKYGSANILFLAMTICVPMVSGVLKRQSRRTTETFSVDSSENACSGIRCTRYLV